MGLLVSFWSLLNFSKGVASAWVIKTRDCNCVESREKILPFLFELTRQVKTPDLYSRTNEAKQVCRIAFP